LSWFLTFCLPLVAQIRVHHHKSAARVVGTLSHPLDIVIFEITYENTATLPDSQTHWWNEIDM